jgi:hypothetical protein
MRSFRTPILFIELSLSLSFGLAGAAWAQTQSPAKTTGGGPANGDSPISLADIAQHPYLVTLIALLIFVAFAAALYYSAQNPNDSYILKLRSSFFFWLGMGYALLLLLLAIVYNASYHDNKPYLIACILPIGVPWFGAVGAVTISLEGIFKWNQHWNSEYNYWHIGRPLFGAILGIVAFYLFVLILISAGSTPPFLADNPQHPPAETDFIIYYVVAFLVGYREETFRELIRRVTDMILKPGTDQHPDSPQLTFKIGGAVVSQINFAKTAAGTEARQTVEILNTGKVSLIAPSLAITASDPGSNAVFKLDKDNVTGVKELGPNQSGTVDVTFVPTDARQYSASLNVAAANLAAPTAIPISGAA